MHYLCRRVLFNLIPGQNNNLQEIFFEQAVNQADGLDAYYLKYGATIRPFHGLSISLENQFHVKGSDTTMGYVV